MIRAVTFDFWNTLYTPADDAETLRRRRDRRVAVVTSFFGMAGKRADSDAVGRSLAALAEAVTSMRVQQQRSFTHAELGRQIARAVGFDLGQKAAEVLAEGVSAVGLGHPPAPLDGAGGLLSRLHRRVRLGIISDTGLTLGMHLREVMASHGLAEYIGHFTWSDETLTTKPAARQFLYTLHMLGVEPAEAVHVGDLEESDITGARAVGMRTIRLLQDASETTADATAGSLTDVEKVLTQWGLDL